MRSPRIAFAGAMYHVTIRCNNREFWFGNDADFALYLQVLQRAKNIYKVAVYAYCLTSNHVHLVVATPKKNNLSRFMQYLNGNFAKAYNQAHGKTGHFWGERFFSTVIESETQLFNTLAYVELNMVRAGVVADPYDWLWSSYRAHVGGETNPVLDRHSLYDALGSSDAERQVAYRAMIVGQMEEKGLGRSGGTEQGTLLTRGLIAGSRAFVEKVLARWRRQAYYRLWEVVEPPDGSGCLIRRLPHSQHR